MRDVGKFGDLRCTRRATGIARSTRRDTRTRLRDDEFGQRIPQAVRLALALPLVVLGTAFLAHVNRFVFGHCSNPRQQFRFS